jgi:hypothetical protein
MRLLLGRMKSPKELPPGPGELLTGLDDETRGERWRAAILGGPPVAFDAARRWLVREPRRSQSRR